jgi:hypothetical protein
MTRNDKIEAIARIGFESQFEEKYNDLAANSIERGLWRQTAVEILRFLEKFRGNNK